MKYLDSCQIENFIEDYLVKENGNIVIIKTLSGKNVMKVI